MNYIKTPISYAEEQCFIERNLDDSVKMLDNLIELIVFTPRGSFNADPDFGFEYWNYEYANVHYKDFNNDQNNNYVNGLYSEITRQECQESIKKSLETYENSLKQIDVLIEIRAIEINKYTSMRLYSKYEIVVSVKGLLNDGLGMCTPYRKEISFLMEPTVKNIKV